MQAAVLEYVGCPVEVPSCQLPLPGSVMRFGNATGLGFSDRKRRFIASRIQLVDACL